MKRGLSLWVLSWFWINHHSWVLGPGHKRNKCESHAVFHCKWLTKWKHQPQRDTATQAVVYKTLSQTWVVCKSVQEGAREITEGDGRQTSCFSTRRCSGHWCRTGKIWDALYGADFSGNEKPCVTILSTKAQGASQSWVSRKNVKR